MVKTEGGKKRMTRERNFLRLVARENKRGDTGRSGTSENAGQGLTKKRKRTESYKDLSAKSAPVRQDERRR